VAVYTIAGFDHAERQRVRDHPEAWSWLLQGTSVNAKDFGPPGSVHDLLPKGSFQLATVAFHQQSTSMIMGALCDLGAVDGVPANVENDFEDECFAAVAHRVHKPVGEVFSKPWMIRATPDKQCNLSLDDSVLATHYKCRWDAKTHATTVAFH
jgi:hypothetical protein